MTHRLLFADIETGGTDIYRHPIIELAAIAVEAGTWRELDVFEAKVAFDVKDADPVALGINKFSPSVWKQYALPEHVVAEKFGAFCRTHATVQRTSKRTGREYWIAQLVGHNAEAFDGPFLREWYRRQRIFFPATMRLLCTKQLAMWLFETNQGLTPPEDYKLATLCDYFGLPVPDHTALRDIRATVALARHIALLQTTPISARAA